MIGFTTLNYLTDFYYNNHNGTRKMKIQFLIYKNKQETFHKINLKINIVLQYIKLFNFDHIFFQKWFFATHFQLNL